MKANEFVIDGKLKVFLVPNNKWGGGSLITEVNGKFYWLAHTERNFDQNAEELTIEIRHTGVQVKQGKVKFPKPAVENIEAATGEK